MMQLAPGWQIDVERGPDWLFVRLDHLDTNSEDTPQLAEKIWELMQQHFINRVILELHPLPMLSSYVIGQLVMLHKRIATHEGMIRLCGLNDASNDTLRMMGLGDRFPRYLDRNEAIRGQRPPQPR